MSVIVGADGVGVFQFASALSVGESSGVFRSGGLLFGSMRGLELVERSSRLFAERDDFVTVLIGQRVGLFACIIVHTGACGFELGPQVGERGLVGFAAGGKVGLEGREATVGLVEGVRLLAVGLFRGLQLVFEGFDLGEMGLAIGRRCAGGSPRR